MSDPTTIRFNQQTFARFVAALAACQWLVLAGCSAQHATMDARRNDASDAESTRFEIQSDFGADSDWVEPYLTRCMRALVRLMDNSAVTPPDVIRVRLEKVADLGGIGGFAGVPEAEVQGQKVKLYVLGFRSASMAEDRARHWIVAHELVNLLAHFYAGGGGFPSDFWSNGRSPFPEYVSCLLMREAGFPDDANWRRDLNATHADHALYWKLDERFGFALFSRFFKLLQSDGVSIGAIGAPWPAPDAKRSLYTVAYLSIAAGENLAPMFRDAGVGHEPSDWSKIHPEIRFDEYQLRDADVTALMAARERHFGSGAPRAENEETRAAKARFRAGEY